jgi:hypothetical protein
MFKRGSALQPSKMFGGVSRVISTDLKCEAAKFLRDQVTKY